MRIEVRQRGISVIRRPVKISAKSAIWRGARMSRMTVYEPMILAMTVGSAHLDIRTFSQNFT